MTNENDYTEQIKERRYTVKIGEHLYKRLGKHIQILKHLEHRGKNKQGWVLEAIKEKLETEEANPSEIIPQERYLAITMNDLLGKRVEKIVSLQKQLRDSYSKKQWFLEALDEKLEKEDSKTREFREEIWREK
ncbi:MAG: hypothetical protein S4CHLAM123_10680 [Chlamydiales bacterium]|nr:hypothetical protein [Chlamydiales bacterium]